MMAPTRMGGPFKACPEPVEGPGFGLSGDVRASRTWGPNDKLHRAWSKNFGGTPPLKPKDGLNGPPLDVMVVKV